MSLDELRMQQARRDALARLALCCAVALALVLLASCGPSDTEIAGTPVSGEADRVAEVRAASVSKPVLVDGDSFHRITTTTAAPTTTTTVAPTTTAAPPVTTTTEAPVAQTSGGDCAGWAGLVAAYFPAEQVTKACSVLACESQGNPRAASPTNDHGLFQLHAGSAGFPGGWQSTFRDVTGVAFFDGVYDPDLNVRFARWLWGQSGWRPWACA